MNSRKNGLVALLAFVCLFLAFRWNARDAPDDRVGNRLGELGEDVDDTRPPAKRLCEVVHDGPHLVFHTLHRPRCES